MKQKLLNDILYVYSTEPYVITEDTSATTIFVPETLYEEYKELNPFLNLEKKNYNIVTVKRPEWAIDEEEPEKGSSFILNETISDMENVLVNTETNTIEVEDNLGSLKVFDNIDEDAAPTYTSSDEEVAEIDEEGLVTINGEGTTTLTVEYEGDDDFEATDESYTLIVAPSESELSSPNISFSSDEIDVYFGEESIIVEPTLSNTNSVEVTYSTDKPDILTINEETGEITQILKEYVTIGSTNYSAHANVYATFAGNGTYFAQQAMYRVNIKKNRQEIPSKWSKPSYEAVINRESEIPTMTGLENVPTTYNSEPTISYSSSDTTKATVNSSGEVTILDSTGENDITITFTFTGTDTLKPKTETCTLKISPDPVHDWLLSYALTDTIPTSETLLDIIDPNFPKPFDPQTIDMTHLDAPTDLYLVYPKAWETIEDELLVKPIVTDNSNGNEIGIWFDSEDPKVTVDGREYRISSIQLGKGTFTIEF